MAVESQYVWNKERKNFQNTVVWKFCDFDNIRCIRYTSYLNTRTTKKKILLELPEGVN